MKKLGKNALENLTLDASCQIDLGSTVTAVDSSNYNSKIVWGFNHDNPIQGDSTFRQQKSFVLDAIEADESTTTSEFSFNYNRVKNGKLILQKMINGNNMSAVMAADTKSSTTSNSMTTKTQRADVTDIYIPFGLRSLYNFVFDSTSIAEIHIPESITNIGKCAFARTQLKEIALPSSVKSVGSQAFYTCLQLENADFSQSAVTNLSSVFQSCNKLKTVVLPNTLQTIEAGTFKGCTALTEITIPSSVTSIDSTAFSGCTNLKTITIKKSTDSIENAPWGATNVEEVLWEEEK